MVFPSHAAAKMIGERLGLPENLRSVVPHGVDGTTFANAEDAERETEVPFLFLPAAIERHKNLELLVDAIPHFAPSGTPQSLDSVADARR